MQTTDEAYTQRLHAEGNRWWKRVLDIRGVYGRNLRRLDPGFTLDVGCGLGRNLLFLRGDAVGIDHNPHSVAECRSRGLRAFTPEEFRATTFARPGAFSSLLLSHVVEHMQFEQAVGLVEEYLPYLDAQRGQVILIAPQERGFRADPTHVEFMDAARLADILTRLSLPVSRSSSFPLPRRPFGRIFRYNEFVVVGRRASVRGPLETGVG
jgi:SAM-dependent methyltransferase